MKFKKSNIESVGIMAIQAISAMSVLTGFRVCWISFFQFDFVHDCYRSLHQVKKGCRRKIRKASILFIAAIVDQ